jgi:replication-associated recombination protein RarA
MWKNMFDMCQVSQKWITLEKLESSSSEATLSSDNSETLTDEVLDNQSKGNHDKMVRKGLSGIWTISSAFEESQLVGREKEKYDLINLISKQDDQQPMVISVWGMGGLGKTTLIKEVYQSQDLSGLFDIRACVTIMRPFVLEEALKSLIMQLDASKGKLTESKAFVDDLHKILQGKRCLIILDDLSSIKEWDMIIQSLPKMKKGSWIVITTREENIAKHCSSRQGSIYKLEVLEKKDALDLFTKKVSMQNLVPFVWLFLTYGDNTTY